MLDAILKYATVPGSSPPFTAASKPRPPPRDSPQQLTGTVLMSLVAKLHLHLGQPAQMH